MAWFLSVFGKDKMLMVGSYGNLANIDRSYALGKNSTFRQFNKQVLIIGSFYRKVRLFINLFGLLISRIYKLKTNKLGQSLSNVDGIGVVHCLV